MSSYNLLMLPGDGIGPEVVNEVERVIDWFNKNTDSKFEIEKDLVGGSAYDAHGAAISDTAMDLAHKSDAIIFGAVGGPKWDNVPFEVRPEAGLLRLRKDLDLFANLRPAICYKALADASSLKRELVEGLDILILRELTGGVYFGEPKEITDLPDGQQKAVDTQIYTTSEVQRIARVAFELAKTRKGKVTSTEKRNVMISGVFWNKVVSEVHKNEYPDMQLEHILADACAMQLVRKPKQFDLIVADNLFGDILSDEAAMLTGSMGMLPSASLGAVNETTGKRNAMYEPVHGSAPDIAGQGIANPIAEIASFAMALRYSFNLTEEAKLIEDSISAALDTGIRTPDIMQDGMKKVGTQQITDVIISEMNSRS
ncbi:MAG: 3-isopropylmalate dehydrogenase [Rhizobiales bacterium]|nr:3-isopropylmalate dehydrogenase [Hyphomicrobiales bacterium]MBL6770240.1 3-isopropylmalate dehydrogenase [Hyphomicrobiales bacterium]